MSNDISSMKVNLSDIRTKRDTKTWLSDNLVVKPEAGDIFFENEEAESESLKKAFEESMRLKELSVHVNPPKMKPLMFDAQGNPMTRGTKPEFTQESISVMKSAAMPSAKAAAALESLGEQVSAGTKEEIKNAMSLNHQDLKFEGKKAKIGTFNIEWLGTKNRPEEAYKEIAQVIKDSDAQILGVQEVSNEKALKKVMNHLPNYGYILGKSGGGQKVAVLFDKNRVKYDVNSIDQIDGAQVGNSLRAPLLVNMKVDDGFDFTFIVVHLKAMFDEQSIEVRTEQATQLHKWIKSHIKDNNDKDVVLVGDFNDFAGSESLGCFSRSKSMAFITKDTPEDFYSNIPHKGVIDHGVLTSVDKGSMEEFIPGSVHTIDENKYPDFENRISDHKPILFEVRTDIDND